jgi:hypothetical protein
MPNFKITLAYDGAEFSGRESSNGRGWRSLAKRFA